MITALNKLIMVEEEARNGAMACVPNVPKCGAVSEI